MQIVLTLEDVRAASQAFKSELNGIIFPAKEGPPVPYPLVGEQLGVFIKGLGASTGAFMVGFLETGRMNYEDALTAADKFIGEELRGVLSGITKRVRKLVGERVVLVDWDYVTEEYYISGKTLAALREYYDWVEDVDVAADVFAE